LRPQKYFEHSTLILGFWPALEKLLTLTVSYPAVNSGEPNQYRLLTTVFNLNREHLEDPVTKVGSAVSIAKNVGTGRDANP
jgi:hypothetical protein